MHRYILIVLLLLPVISGCSSGPAEINWGTDQCAHCGMIITDRQFAAQLISSKGKPYLFDAIECLAAWQKDNTELSQGGKSYVCNYTTKLWVDASAAHYLITGEWRSPMGLNAAAFSSEAEYSSYNKEKVTALSLKDILSNEHLR